MMTTRLFIIGVALVLGCQGSARGEAAAQEAFDGLIRALDERDAAALWSLADDETRALFDGLALEINDALDRIERCYPEDLRPEARRAVGGGYLFRGGRGEDLFRALLDPARLRGPKDPESRRVLRVVLRSREAVVVTAAHDTFRFTRNREGRYQTDLLLRSLAKQAALSDLRKNLEAVRRDCLESSSSRPPLGE